MLLKYGAITGENNLVFSNEVYTLLTQSIEPPDNLLLQLGINNPNSDQSKSTSDFLPIFSLYYFLYYFLLFLWLLSSKTERVYKIKKRATQISYVYT